MNKLAVLLVVLVPLLATGGQKVAQDAAATAGSTVGKLAIEVHRGGFPYRDDIFVLAPLKSKPKRLVEGLNPAWSPDGEKLAFCVRYGSGFGQIQLITADGSGKTQLTNLKGGACLPDWSPDGNKIAFTAYSAKTPKILAMDKNGQNVTEIIAGYGARWSPNGKQLVFCRNPEGHGTSGSIWIANADGTGATRVIEDNSTVLEATWFPDGKSIAFSSKRENKHKSAIFRVNIDGSGLEAVAVDKRLSFYFPLLSPDGQQLVADGYTIGTGEGNVFLLALASHQASVLAHGIHPSVLWEKR